MKITRKYIAEKFHAAKNILRDVRDAVRLADFRELYYEHELDGNIIVGLFALFSSPFIYQYYPKTAAAIASASILLLLEPPIRIAVEARKYLPIIQERNALMNKKSPGLRNSLI